MKTAYPLIDPYQFPMPGVSYSGGQDHVLAYSIMAFATQMISHAGNLLEDKAWQFMFRDWMIPRPRLCTILAWDGICRLGSKDSKVFMLPFLPSITEDDQMYGVQNNSGLHSLHRASKHHVRVDRQIQWGCIYLGFIGQGPPIFKTVEVSSIVEAQVLGFKGTRQFINGESSQYSIRDRMEYLAANGIPAVDELFDQKKMPRVDRLMFQFLNQKSAEVWADSYLEATNEYHQCKNPREAIKNDWKDMVDSIIEMQRVKEIAKLTGEKEKNNPKKVRFDMKDIEF